MSEHRYAIITPARDEAAYIEQTLHSVTSQTAPPGVWLIVDDGSTDETGEIVRRYVDRYPFMRLVESGGHTVAQGADRLSLGAEIVAFNRGLAELRLADYDFIVKLDADISFEPDYFERLFARFDADPLLGLAGGQLYEEHDGELMADRDPAWHVRGATKVYRRQCFEDIGGLVPLLGWDGVDEAQAHLAGWRSRTFDEPRCVHLRQQGTSGGGIVHGRARLGLASYVLHYHPLWVLVRSLRLGANKPYFLGGIAYVWGYLEGVVRRPARLQDEAAAAYIRQAQMERLRGIEPYVIPDEALPAATGDLL
jgi:biofilm PGA synthesis N-glycosyltransferase PgaC